MTPHIDIKSASRLISLMRILLFALAVGVIFLMGINELSFVLNDQGTWLTGLVMAIAVACILLAIFAGFIRRHFILVIELIFDILWLGGVIYMCGGVLGPAAPLMFALVIIGALVLPGLAPFLLSSLGALALMSIAGLYLADVVPYQDVESVSKRNLGDSDLIISTVSVQVVALFLIDILGQILARRTSEQHLIVGDLLDQIGDGVILVDRKGEIRHINDRALSFLGFSSEDMKQDVQGLFAKSGLERLRYLLFEGSGVGTEYVSLAQHHILVISNDVHGRRGRLFGRMLSLRDETSLKNMEENVRRAEHLASLGEMAAGIAHEIRNPLTSLRGCAQEIKAIGKNQEDKNVRQLSRIILNEADRLSHIVDDVLGFARQHSLFVQPIPVTEFLAEIEQEYRSHLKLPEDISLEIEVSDSCPALLSDAEKLKQIIQNLVDNAVHALDGVDAARIRIHAQQAEEHILDTGTRSVSLSVIDNGSGIETERLTQVFTPFYSTRSQGTGLGLAMVQRLVRALGGVVRLDSSVGEGTSVTLLLPADDQQFS